MSRLTPFLLKWDDEYGLQRCIGGVHEHVACYVVLDVRLCGGLGWQRCHCSINRLLNVSPINMVIVRPCLRQGQGRNLRMGLESSLNVIRISCQCGCNWPVAGQLSIGGTEATDNERRDNEVIDEFAPISCRAGAG